MQGTSKDCPSYLYLPGALFEYSVILLRMKIKTIRQIRKCMNGNLAAYLAPLANPLGGPITNGIANRPQQQTQGGTQFPAFDPTSKVDLVFLCCFPCLFLIFSIVYVIAFYFWDEWLYDEKTMRYSMLYFKQNFDNKQSSFHSLINCPKSTKWKIRVAIELLGKLDRAL